MNIRALIVGLAVYCSPIWAQIDVSQCGKTQGCFIQPPNCNNGNDFANCAVAASFQKFTDDAKKDWIDIMLVTSIVHPIMNPIGGDTGVYAALGLSNDTYMVWLQFETKIQLKG